MNALPVLVISLPLLGALSSLLFARQARSAAMLAVIGNLLLAVALLMVVARGPLTYALGGWATPLGIALQADAFGALMIGITALVGAAVSVYSLSYFTRGATGERSFWPLWCLLLTALNVLFLSQDLFNLYVGLEILSLAAVALVTLAGHHEALRAALRYLLASLTGSLCYLLGVALLYHAHATLDMTLLAARVDDALLERAALALMTVGLLLKTALFPLHFWLPLAHGSAPAPVSALLSALVVKATFYVLLRLWLDVLEGAATVTGLLLLGLLGCAAILWGSLQALRTPRLKLLVAYSTVAQIGYLFALFPLLGRPPVAVDALNAAIYFICAHASAKAALFLAAGNVQSHAGHDRIADLSTSNLPSPITLFALAIASVSLIGLPPSGGFIAKWLLLQGALQESQWWLATVVMLGGLLAAAYLLRVVALCFSKAASQQAPAIAAATAGVSAGREWSALGLALAALLLGFTAGPLLVFFDAASMLR